MHTMHQGQRNSIAEEVQKRNSLSLCRTRLKQAKLSMHWLCKASMQLVCLLIILQRYAPELLKQQA